MGEQGRTWNGHSRTNSEAPDHCIRDREELGFLGEVICPRFDYEEIFDFLDDIGPTDGPAGSAEEIAGTRPLRRRTWAKKIRRYNKREYVRISGVVSRAVSGEPRGGGASSLSLSGFHGDFPRGCYELGLKPHRNADSRVGLLSSQSMFSAFLSHS